MQTPFYTARVSLRFKSRILDHLAHDGYRPVTIREVARQLGVEDEDRREFDAAVDQLSVSGKVEILPPAP